jgi:hypothetical protein
MHRHFSITAVVFLLSMNWASAQQPSYRPATIAAASHAEFDPSIVQPSQITPEAALLGMEQRSFEQAKKLDGYQSETFITADLVDTSKHGEFELVRKFTAEPRSLSYSSVRYQGDGFVKTQVINKFLQAEVDHIKDDPRASAINEANYKFSYKGTQTLDGHMTHVFHIKPKQKRPGLFKGKIYLDAYSGTLRRMEGRVSKSPSFFIRSIDFVQDFDEVDGFTMPTRLQSTTRARVIGRAIVSIVHRAYVLKSHRSPDSNANEVATATGGGLK